MAFTKASPSAAPLGIQSLCGRCVTFLSRKTDTSEIAFAAQQTGGEVLRLKYGACREGRQKMRFAFSRFVQTPTRAEPCAPCSGCPEKDTMGSDEGGGSPGEARHTPMVNRGRGPSCRSSGWGALKRPTRGGSCLPAWKLGVPVAHAVIPYEVKRSHHPSAASP